MKDVNGVLSYKGKEYKYFFNLNVMEAIQDEYGSVEAWGNLTDGEGGKKEPNAKAIIFGMTEMLNEGILIENEDNGTNEPLFTRRQVGRMVTDLGLQNVTKNMNETVIKSTESERKNA